MNKKHILGITLVAITSVAFAGAADPYDVRFVQNNTIGNGTLNRYLQFPTDGSSCLTYLDGPSILPGCVQLGTGLSITGGKLVSSASGVAGPQGPQGIQGVKGDKGDKGDTGDVGPKGDVGATGPKGDTGAQGIQGIQGVKGDIGSQGIQGIQGVAGVAGVNAFSAPVARTVVAGSAYQTSALKPTHVMLTLTSTSSISLTGSSNNAASIYIGPTAAVATGSGTVVGKYSNVLGGGLVVGLNLNTTQSNTYSIAVPAGWYYAVVVTTGTGLVIDSVVEQTAG